MCCFSPMSLCFLVTCCLKHCNILLGTRTMNAPDNDKVTTTGLMQQITWLTFLSLPSSISIIITCVLCTTTSITTVELTWWQLWWRVVTTLFVVTDSWHKPTCWQVWPLPCRHHLNSHNEVHLASLRHVQQQRQEETWKHSWRTKERQGSHEGGLRLNSFDSSFPPSLTSAGGSTPSCSSVFFTFLMQLPLVPAVWLQWHAIAVVLRKQNGSKIFTAGTFFSGSPWVSSDPLTSIGLLHGVFETGVEFCFTSPLTFKVFSWAVVIERSFRAIGVSSFKNELKFGSPWISPFIVRC